MEVDQPKQSKEIGWDFCVGVGRGGLRVGLGEWLWEMCSWEPDWSADLQFLWIMNAYLNTELTSFFLLLQICCNQCESKDVNDETLSWSVTGRGLDMVHVGQVFVFAEMLGYLVVWCRNSCYIPSWFDDLFQRTATFDSKRDISAPFLLIKT